MYGNVSFFPGLYSAIFDMNTNQAQRLNDKLTDCLHALFTLDSAYLITVCDNNITAWEVKSGKKVSEMVIKEDTFRFSGGHYDDYKKFTFALPGNRLLGRGFSYDTKCILYIWDLKSGEVLHELKGHSYSVDIIGVSDSDKRAITGTASTGSSSDCGPKFFRVWDLEKGTEIACSKVTGPYTVLGFLGQHQDYLLTSTYFEVETLLWLVQGEQLLPVYEILGHSSKVVFAESALDGKLLITASVDNTLKLWSLPEIMNKANNLLRRCSTVEHIQAEREEKKKMPAVSGEGKVETTSFAVSW